MRLRFWKMSGAGNDFVLVEKASLRGTAASLAGLARRLCERRGGVGADGLLAVSRRGRRLRLEYHNADGSAAFCGNGTRCAAWWAYRRGWTGSRRDFVLETLEGPLAVRVAGPERAAVSMPQPGAARLGLKLRALGRTLLVHSIDTGVPHAVVVVKNLEKTDVVGLGRALRSHKAFGRRGANVDFAQFTPQGLAVRTYERGVEAETLACGTGAVAAAVVARLLGRGSFPARVKTRGGDVLTVSSQTSGEVGLEGPARVLFTGEVEL